MSLQGRAHEDGAEPCAKKQRLSPDPPAFKLTDPPEDWSDDALIAFLTDEKNRRCQPTLLRVVDYYKPALFGVSRFTLELEHPLLRQGVRITLPSAVVEHVTAWKHLIVEYAFDEVAD